MIAPKEIFHIIKSTNLNPTPDRYEELAASILAKYLKSDIEFIPRSGPAIADILAVRLNQIWEIKTIRGSSRNTIHNSLKGVVRQSENLIISLVRTKLPQSSAIYQIMDYTKNATRIKRILLISKNHQVLVIKGKI